MYVAVLVVLTNLSPTSTPAVMNVALVSVKAYPNVVIPPRAVTVPVASCLPIRELVNVVIELWSGCNGNPMKFPPGIKKKLKASKAAVIVAVAVEVPELLAPSVAVIVIWNGPGGWP